jgi:hypothetical protein
LAFHAAELGFHELKPALFKINFRQSDMSQLSDIHGNADMSINKMLWSRGGERPEGLVLAPQKLGTRNVFAH